MAMVDGRIFGLQSESGCTVRLATDVVAPPIDSSISSQAEKEGRTYTRAQREINKQTSKHKKKNSLAAIHRNHTARTQLS